MSNALITGVNGFTGRYLALELQQAGYDVYGFTHHHSPPIAGVKALYSSDLSDVEQLTDIINTVQPEIVAHLAAIAFVAHGDIADIYRTNVLGTRCLLEALTKAVKTVKAVLLISSANVYGSTQAGKLTETTPLSPANDYAVSKVAMEYLARLYTTSLPLVIARPFNYTGIGQSERFLLPKIVNHIRRAAPVIELGNLEVARDFSDVRTIVHYYRRLLETQAAIGQTFNLCSGTAHTLQEVLCTVRELSGHDIEVHVNPAFVRENEVKILLGDASKLQTTAGTLPTIPLTETLRWMLAE
jgi:nucleoside-diphosphate-sugar epimerase